MVPIGCSYWWLILLAFHVVVDHFSISRLQICSMPLLVASMNLYGAYMVIHGGELLRAAPYRIPSLCVRIFRGTPWLKANPVDVYC